MTYNTESVSLAKSKYGNNVINNTVIKYSKGKTIILKVATIIVPVLFEGYFSWLAYSLVRPMLFYLCILIITSETCIN